jgi:ABC-2 type transport system ATP-binding protein
MSEPVIKTHQLSKVFGDKTAVDSLSIELNAGSILGFLGVNGAGKTTMMRMLMGHLHPTGGTMSVIGSDPWNWTQRERCKVAYVSENMNLPGWMKPKDAIAASKSFYPEWNCSLAESLLGKFELQDAGLYKSMSKGQKRKMCILLALCQRAELLVMDEPAAGLDVTARRAFIEQILEVACNDNTAVFLSSHLLSDLERTIDQVALIDNGKLLLQDHLEDLKEASRKLHISKHIEKTSLAEFFNIVSFDASDQGETIAVVRDYNDEKFSQFAQKYNCLEAAKVYSMNLEDMFIELTKTKS